MSAQDPQALEDLARAVAGVARESNTAMRGFLEKQASSDLKALDPLGLGSAFLQLTANLMANPRPFIQAQLDAWQAYARIWNNAALSMVGAPQELVVEADKNDRRFRSPHWEDHPFFNYLKQFYLVSANTIQSMVAGVEDLDDKTAHKIRFYTKQFVDAVAPTNFVLTNPEVLKATIDSHGENLLRGLQNFLEDFDPKHGRLRTRMTDESAFDLGRNIAVTPGSVVYQNEMMQLIQYQPTTAEVYQRPLLIIPPWINKFYILDLQQSNSFIKWALDQGHSVFVISWVNPDAAMADKDFEDYLFEGPMAALDAIGQATGERTANVIGYCLGGTLFGAMLSYLRATGDADRVASATFFAALLDFSDPGDLGVFIDEAQLSALEEKMEGRGYLDGASMATTFNMLRSNDLIWSFVINNYLLGKDPFPFDLLYWNADATRMPAQMHKTYLRTMYLENRFCQPGGIHIRGVPIDLSKIEAPACFIATAEDHIAPWKGSFKGAQLLAGPLEFILGKSGHIAGIINPPAANKYGYYRNEDRNVTADDWLAGADSFDGSWWPEWSRWVTAFAGPKVRARVPGDGALHVIEPAPGSYVRVRSD